MTGQLVSQVVPVLQVLSQYLKVPILALLAFNLNAFPGLWHLWTVIPFFVYQLENAMGKKRVNPHVGLDPFEYRESRTFRATPDRCDAFGLHMSNSSYASCADHLRGPGTVSLVGAYFELPGASFALGETSYKFLREIGMMAKFKSTQRLLGYDKKWLYILQTFTTTSSTGKVTVHCNVLSHLVLKIGRRTVPPVKAFALAGYGPSGAKNWEVVKTMSKSDRKKWLFAVPGEEDHDRWKIELGSVEEGMDQKDQWLNAV